MSAFDGASTIDIDAPIEEVFAHVADLEAAPRWQPDLKRVECLEWDDAGRPVLVRTDLETAIRRTTSLLRVTYEPCSVMRWTMEEGDVKAFTGSWALTALGPGSTRADYAVAIDFGRKLGMLVRGPVVTAMRGTVVSSMPGKLKAYVESAPVRT